jgi:hypothetical protein
LAILWFIKSKDAVIQFFYETNYDKIRTSSVKGQILITYTPTAKFRFDKPDL